MGNEIVHQQLAVSRQIVDDLRKKLAAAEGDVSLLNDRVAEYQKQWGEALEREEALIERVEKAERALYDSNTCCFPAGTHQALVQLGDEREKMAPALVAAVSRVSELEEALREVLSAHGCKSGPCSCSRCDRARSLL